MCRQRPLQVIKWREAGVVQHGQPSRLDQALVAIVIVVVVVIGRCQGIEAELTLVDGVEGLERDSWRGAAAGALARGVRLPEDRAGRSGQRGRERSGDPGKMGGRGWEGLLG